MAYGQRKAQERLLKLHRSGKLHSWSYEQDYKILRTDGFIAIKNTMSGKFRFMFLEMDRGTNAFNKVDLYNKLYEKEKYAHWWWVPLSERFPVVQIVTVSDSRKRLIQSEIDAKNSAGLEFKVRLLDDVRKEVMNRCLGLCGQNV